MSGGVEAEKPPCREFERLNYWLGKYAMRRLDPGEVFATRSDGTKVTIGRDADMSKLVKDWLKENRRKGDVIYLKSIPRRYKGKEMSNLMIRIATPTGRLKAEEVFRM